MIVCCFRHNLIIYKIVHACRTASGITHGPICFYRGRSIEQQRIYSGDEEQIVEGSRETERHGFHKIHAGGVEVRQRQQADFVDSFVPKMLCLFLA